MNANELLAYNQGYNAGLKAGIDLNIEPMLRRLQKERDLLFNAHSHEMKRADESQVEVDRLTMLVEAMTTECNRLYRVIELNGKIE